MSYARDGLPFLVNHDTDRVAGRVEDIAPRADGKLAGKVRFGRSALAAEIRQDIEDGIRPNVSVGYRVDAMQLVETRDGLDVYRVTRWTPMEASTVPVPADVSVGVGRDAERAAFPVEVTSPSRPTPERESATMSETTKVESAAQVGVVGESRETELKMIGEAARTFKMEAKLPEWIGRGATLEDVRKDIEAANVAAAKAPGAPGHVDLTERQHREYNPMRAIAAHAFGSWERDGGFEKEVSDDIAKRLGKPRGFYLPMNLRAAVTGNVAGTASLGGNAVEMQLVGFEDLLRNRMLVRGLGAQMLTGLTGNVAIPRQITANTLSWTGENPSTANALTEATFDQISLSPKTAMASTAYSRQAAVQTSPAIAGLVMSDLATIVAIGIDAAALRGTGSSNQPTGIAAQTGINTNAIGTNGGNLTWAIVVASETAAAVDNADFGTMHWVTTPGVRGSAKTILKSTTAGSQYLWSDDNRINGYQAHATNQLRTNLTKGTSTAICHEAIFGNFGQLLIGEWGGAVDLLVNPYTYASQGMIAVHAHVMVDTAVRQPTAFVYTADILV